MMIHGEGGGNKDIHGYKAENDKRCSDSMRMQGSKEKKDEKPKSIG